MEDKVAPATKTSKEEEADGAEAGFLLTYSIVTAAVAGYGAYELSGYVWAGWMVGLLLVPLINRYLDWVD